MRGGGRRGAEAKTKENNRYAGTIRMQRGKKPRLNKMRRRVSEWTQEHRMAAHVRLRRT